MAYNQLNLESNQQPSRCKKTTLPELNEKSVMYFFSFRQRAIFFISTKHPFLLKKYNRYLLWEPRLLLSRFLFSIFVHLFANMLVEAFFQTNKTISLESFSNR